MPLLQDIDATRIYDVPAFWQRAGDPAIIDDIEHGYRVGDQWLSVETGIFWHCISNDANAAYWCQSGFGWSEPAQHYAHRFGPRTKPRRPEPLSMKPYRSV
jgi:hypothetical protein